MSMVSIIFSFLWVSSGVWLTTAVWFWASEEHRLGCFHVVEIFVYKCQGRFSETVRKCMVIKCKPIAIYMYQYMKISNTVKPVLAATPSESCPPDAFCYISIATPVKQSAASQIVTAKLITYWNGHFASLRITSSATLSWSHSDICAKQLIIMSPILKTDLVVLG